MMAKPDQATKNILILFSQPPYDGLLSREAMDIMFSFTAYRQPVCPVFIGNGVFQLVKNQNPAKIGAKNSAKMLSALGLYGIEKVYVDSDSLLARGLTTSHLLIEHEIATIDRIGQLIDQADQVFHY
ncbi:MAG: sulfurtransferase complex subunit TusC [Gammaproteobacteria bacterium]|nr:MAG: sulfurtransferase complex subunit TusC [Gammaproteobacteria bacterium]